MAMQEALDFGAMALFGREVRRARARAALRPDLDRTVRWHPCRPHRATSACSRSCPKVASAGVRRIEAVTGQGALDHVAEEERRLDEAAALLGGTSGDVADKLRALLDRQKKLERELEAIKAKAASGATSDLGSQARDVDGIKVLAARLEGFDAKALRDAMDRLKQQLGDAVIVLAGTDGGKAALVAGVSGAATGKVKAGDLLGDVARQVNGKGGGRPDMAQGGGDDGPALGGRARSRAGRGWPSASRRIDAAHTAMGVVVEPSHAPDDRGGSDDPAARFRGGCGRSSRLDLDEAGRRASTTAMPSPSRCLASKGTNRGSHWHHRAKTIIPPCIARRSTSASRAMTEQRDGEAKG